MVPWLAAAVAKRGISKNDLVREALAAYLGRTEDAEMESILTLAGKLGRVDIYEIIAP